MAPLTVLHLIDTAGPHRYFDTLAAHADPARERLIVGCVGPPGPLQDAMRGAGVATFALGARSRAGYPRAVGALARVLARPVAGGGRAEGRGSRADSRGPVTDDREQRAAGNEERAEGRGRRVDVVQVHLPDGALVGLAAARLARTPVTVFTAHHSHELPFHGYKLRAIDGLCAGVLAGHTIAPSEAVAQTLVERARVPRERIAVVHHGFDLDRFGSPSRGPAVRAELGLDGGDVIVIGAIARNYRLKNLEGLVRAFALAVAGGASGAADAPGAAGAQLLIVGGGDHESLRSLARELGVADRVRLEGPREDVPDVIAAMDAFVQPSLAESFGMVLIEAMAVGRPVLSTPVGIAPEAITPGVNGLLARSGRPHELADAVRELLACRARWPEMGEAARATARGFPIAGMVAAYEDCYERWIANRRGSELPVR